MALISLANAQIFVSICARSFVLQEIENRRFQNLTRIPSAQSTTARIRDEDSLVVGFRLLITGMHVNRSLKRLQMNNYSQYETNQYGFKFV